MTRDPRKTNLKNEVSSPMNSERIANYKKYLTLKGYRPSSIKALIKAAESYESYFQKSGYLTYLDQRELQTGKGQRLSTSSIQTYHYRLKHYLYYLESIEQETPAIVILPRKKSSIKAVEILSEEDIDQLYRGCKDLREQAVLTLLYNVGLRIGEASVVSLEDFRAEEQLLQIKSSKSRRGRQVPLSARSCEILAGYINIERKPQGGKAIIQGKGGDIGSFSLRRILKNISKRTLPGKKIYPHLLRHSIASHLLQRGMDIEQISKFLGHSSLESTQHYTHISRGSKK